MPPSGFQYSDLRQDTVFFGRSGELQELVKNLQRGRHTLLVGSKGIGKSRLMLEAKWILSGRTKHIDVFPGKVTTQGRSLGTPIDPGQYKVLFIEHAVPLGACIQEMLEKLFYNGDLCVEADEERPDWRAMTKYLSRLGNVRSESVVFESIFRSKKPYLIFFDSMDRISPTQYKFLEILLDVSVVCSAVIQMKELPAIRRIWASFARIELEPLPESACVRLIDYFFENYPLRAVDAELYRREILKASNGNPFHIKNMLWHGSREPFVGIDDIRKLRQLDEGRYFNMGPVYIFGVAMFTLFRIFSIGMDNKEFYIYFSALGFLAYMAFRVFRAFFLFRPQKYQ